MERKSVYFKAKVEPIKPVNEEFTLCKVYVCALDKNRNFSYIGEDAANDALPTLFNIPVVGHIYEDKEGNRRMGGHDMTIEKNENGEYYFKSVCVPYGVVPQQDNVRYEEVEEPEGRGKKTYIVADAILWTGRYPELKEVIYSDGCWFNQSMEIGVQEYAPLDEDKNYTNILKYSYSALCLLGKSDDPDYNVDPCFLESKVEPYEFALENAQFTELMERLKTELASCFTNNKEGGDVLENKTTEIENPVAEEKVDEPTTDYDSSESEKNVASFSATYKEKREAIERVLPNKVEMNEEDDRVVRDVYFCLCDFDDKYVYVEKNEYISNDDGYEYTSQKGRFDYSYDESAKVATINGDMALMFVKWLTKEEVDEIEKMRAEYEELVDYKKKKCKAEHDAEIDEAIDEFADLEGNEEYAAVVAEKYSFANADDLKTACYIIRGKSVKPQTNKATAAVTVPVGANVEPTIYEGFFARYGKKN